MVFSAFAIVVVAGAVIWMLIVGKDEFARFALEALLFGGAGGIGGYALGRQRGWREAIEQEEEIESTYDGS